MAKTDSTVSPRRPRRGNAVIRNAIAALDAQLREPGEALNNPESCRQYLRLHLDGLEQEVFAGLFLDSQNRLIEYRELSRGTLTQTSVYPREIVKQALGLNAAGVIFAHNHPSGVAEASQADIELTAKLTDALGRVDVRVHDHFIVAGATVLSLNEAGQMPASGADSEVATGKKTAGENPYLSGDSGISGLLNNLQCFPPEWMGAVFTSDYGPQRLAAIASQASNVKDQALWGIKTLGSLIAVAVQSGELNQNDTMNSGWLVGFLGGIASIANVYEANARHARDHGTLGHREQPADRSPAHS